MDALAAIFSAQSQPPVVSFGGPEDPIAFLKEQSADGEGIEVLAILADILEAPYAIVTEADGSTTYVWPALATYNDLAALTPAERVAGVRIMGAERFAGEIEMGSWYYWRLFIRQDGAIDAFVVGD